MAILRIPEGQREGHGPHSVQSYEKFSWSHGRINFRRLDGAYVWPASPDTLDDATRTSKNLAVGVQSEQKMPERP